MRTLIVHWLVSGWRKPPTSEADQMELEQIVTSKAEREERDRHSADIARRIAQIDAETMRMTGRSS